LSRSGCSFAQAIKLLSSDPLGGGGVGRQNSFRAPCWASCASSTITAPSTKPWQKFTAAVIIGSFGSGAQMAIRSRTVRGGKLDSTTAAELVVTPPHSSSVLSTKHLARIRKPPPHHSPPSGDDGRGFGYHKPHAYATLLGLIQRKAPRSAEFLEPTNSAREQTRKTLRSLPRTMQPIQAFYAGGGTSR
jgi:hypothetical protein